MNYELRNILIKFIILNLSFIIFLSSCSVERQIARSANKDVLDAEPLQTAHVGISIYEPATNKYWYNYQGDKYFTPASNTKIATCYAAMRYLRDSLVGLKYAEVKAPNDSGFIFLKPTGDPTFLNSNFQNQPVYKFLNDGNRKFMWKFLKREFNSLGFGWSWDDYQEKYMVERSLFPIYGNLVEIIQNEFEYYAIPSYFNDKLNLGQGIKDQLKGSERRMHFFLTRFQQTEISLCRLSQMM